MRTVILVGQLAIALAVAQPLLAECADLGEPATWRASLAEKLNRTPDLTAITEKLLIKYDPDSDIVRPTVGDARFVDLDGDGLLELVALVDYSGRPFFNNIVVLTTRAGSPVTVTYRSNGVSMTNLSNRILSESGSAKRFVVIDQVIDRYEGAMPSPKEQRVLELKAGALADVSKEHRDYFLIKRIPALEKQIGPASSQNRSSGSISTSPTETDPQFVLRAELERAKLQSLGE